MDDGLKKCRSCGARIFWATSVHGRAMPIDAEPSVTGTLFVSRSGVAVHCQSDHGLAATERGDPKYVSHFATCPGAELHRKKKTK